MNREEEVKAIAYRIWEEEDYSHGRDVEHWLEAEEIWELEQENKASSMDVEEEPELTTGIGKRNLAAGKKR